MTPTTKTVYICSGEGYKHFLTISGEWVDVSDCLIHCYELTYEATETLRAKGTYIDPESKLYFHL